MTKHSGFDLTGAAFDGVHYFTAPSRRVLSRRLEPALAQLIVILGGTYKAHYETESARKTLLAAAGDVVFWTPGRVRTEENDPRQPTRCISLYFRWPRPSPQLPVTVRDYHQMIGHLANELLAIKNVPLHQNLMFPLSHAYLGAMLAEYVRLAQLAEDNIVSRVARFIEEHMADPLRLTDLARHVGLEVHHFGRTYRTLTGKTPMQEVRRRKAQHARGMLMSLPVPTLRAVAPRVGIRGESQLSRILSRYAGASAREIRKMLLRTKHPQPRHGTQKRHSTEVQKARQRVDRMNRM